MCLQGVLEVAFYMTGCINYDFADLLFVLEVFLPKTFFVAAV